MKCCLCGRVQVCKALAQSNDHVLSLAASFSPIADAHLVCLQLDDGSYQTQAINIQHSPRKGLPFSVDMLAVQLVGLKNGSDGRVKQFRAIQ